MEKIIVSMNSYWFCSVEHWLSLLTKPYTAESPWRFFYQSTKGSTVMPRQHYSSPITAVRQWRGYDATANVFNEVNRHLCDDSVFCLDGEGFALRTPAPAGKHSACGNVSLRS